MLTRFRSLRFRLSLTHGVVIAVLVVCASVIRYQIVSRKTLANFDRQLKSDADLLVSRIRFRPGDFRWDTEGLAARELLIIEELRVSAIVSDVNGKVLLPKEGSRFTQRLVESGVLSDVLTHSEGYSTVELPHRFRFVHVPVWRHGTFVPIVLHFGRSVEGLELVLDDYVLAYVVSTPVVILMAGVIGWFFAGRALRPFAEIARATERINSRNLQTQIAAGRREIEVQRLVDAFNSMVRRLDESFRQMRRFNEDVAHELRTPLTILQGETEVALRTQELPEDIRSTLASNLEELTRLGRIVDDFLTLADADAGMYAPDMRPVDLKTLLADLVDQMDLLAADRGLKLIFGSIPECRVRGDELWLRRAFLNLIDNAIKYSRDQGVVEVSGVSDRSRIRIRVKDDGIGIAAAHLPHIFDRLYRADPARNRLSGGVGLGLALVKSIIETHGGGISVTSLPGRGTTFEVDLPAAEEVTSGDLQVDDG